MPVTFARPPVEVLDELARTLPRIAVSDSVRQRSPAITRAAGRFTLAQDMRVARAPAEIADADALPIPVYIVGLADLATGRLDEGARLTLWTHIVTTEAGPVSAEVSSAGNRFSQITNNAAAGRLRSSLIRVAQGDVAEGAEEQDGEAAELRIPALHLSFLWIRGARGQLEVLDSSEPTLRVGQSFTLAELEQRLRPIAEARLAGGDREG